MSKRFEGAAETVVFCVVGGLLDAVAAADCGGAMGGVGFVGCEVNFAEESIWDILVGWAGRRQGGERRNEYFCSWCLSLRTMLRDERRLTGYTEEAQNARLEL